MISILSDPSYLLPPLIAAIVTLSLIIVVSLWSRWNFGTALFCAFLAGMLLWNLLIFGMRSSVEIYHALLWDRAVSVIAPTAFLIYYHFTLVYTKSRGQRRILFAAYSLLAIVAALAPTDLLIKAMRVEEYGYAPIMGPASYFLFPFGILLIIGGASNLLRRYRLSHSLEERNRLAYLAIAVVFPIAGGLLDGFTNLPPVGIWSNLAFCVLCTIAILKYHLLDVRVIIRRSLTYLLVSFVIAVPYAGILLLLNYILRTRAEPWWVHAVIILLLAILLRPLYSWAQNLVDRLFYRDRYDYLRALEQFSQKAQSVVNLKELSSSLTQLVSGALRTLSACLLLPSGSDNDFVIASSTGLAIPPSGVVLKNNSLLTKWLKLQQRILSSEEFNIVPQLQSLSLRERDNLKQLEAQLCVPIQTGPGQLSGILVVGQKLSQQPFSSDDRQLLTALGSQMAMALENARLYAASQQEVAERKKAEEKRQTILKTALDGFWLTSLEGKLLEVNESYCKMVGYTREELIKMSISDLEALETPEEIAQHIKKIVAQGYDRFETRHKRKDGKIIDVEMSVNYLDVGGGQFFVFARDITERKRAEEDLRQSHEQLRNLSAHIESARETERTSIAREVHDELGQALTAIKMDLSWLSKRLPEEQEVIIKKTGEMSRLIDTTIRTVKRISTELRPGVLDDLGLIAAIEWQAQEFQERTRIKCEFTADSEDVNLDRDLATAVFRILQEALTNVARHANATRVEVNLKKGDRQLVLQVRDNGKGITKKQITHPKSFGLIGMHERVRSWNGIVKIDGISGEGTTVTVSIPLKRKEERDDKNTSR